MAVKVQPDGYHTVTPNLVVEGAADLLRFMSSVFGATERMRMDMPDGKIAHAEYLIGDSAVMVADASETFPAATGYLHVYVNDSDGIYEKALAAGAKSIMPPETQFYGDRSANVRDRWGNIWTISTHVEDVSEEEMERRMAAMAPA